MQPPESVASPPARDIARIAESKLFLIEVAANELHNGAFAKIYCGYGKHFSYEFETEARYSRTKANPGAELFSG